MSESANDTQDLQKIQKRRVSLAVKLTPSVVKDAKSFNERNEQAWVDSNEVKKCSRCNVKFTVTNRKHHCRECGKVFCNTCSSFKIVIEGSVKRVCSSVNMTV